MALIALGIQALSMTLNRRPRHCQLLQAPLSSMLYQAILTPKSSMISSKAPMSPPNSDLDVSQLSSLMLSAHECGDKPALKQVRAFITKAARTQPSKRTPAQKYVLTHWRRPSSRLRRPSLRSRRSSTLLVPSTTRPTSQLAQSSPSSLSSLEIIVDASAHGIGLIFNDRWLAWTFTPKHPAIFVEPDNNIDTSSAELIAVELGILTLLAGGYRDIRVLVKSDHKDVVSALSMKTCKSNNGLDIILARTLLLCEEARLELQVEWISSKENPADGPSRGKYPAPDKMLMITHMPSIPQHLEGLVSQAVAA